MSTIPSDEVLQNMSNLDYIPNEVLCEIAMKLTDPSDISHFMTAYTAGEATARRCVTMIDSPNATVKAKFILKFVHLQSVNVMEIITKRIEEYVFLRFKLETNN